MRSKVLKTKIPLKNQMIRSIAVLALVGFASPSFGGEFDEFYDSLAGYECFDADEPGDVLQRILLAEIAGKLEVLLPSVKGESSLTASRTTKGFKFTDDQSIAFLSRIDGAWTLYASSEKGNMVFLCKELSDVTRAIAKALHSISPELTELAEVAHLHNQVKELQQRNKTLEAEILGSVRPKSRNSSESSKALAASIDVGDGKRPRIPLTSAEKASLKIEIQACWAAPEDGNEAIVVVSVSLDKTAKPLSSSISLVSSLGGSPDEVDQVFEAARRAIVRCGVSGFNLPAEKYDTWKTIEMTFPPRGVRP